MIDPRHNDEIILEKISGLERFLSIKFEEVEKHIEKSEKVSEEFNKRINLVELWKENSIGKLSVIMIGIGVAISVLTAWINGHLK